MGQSGMTDRRRAGLGLAIVCLGTFAAPLDSAVNIALPGISAAFDAPISEIRWIVIAYVLTYSCLLLIFGKIGDLIGYARVFRAGLSLSALGFLACAAATVYPLLLAGRVLQGVGIALTLSCAPALATTLYPESERTRVLGIYTAMTAAGAALGPILGGLMVDRFGWSAVFWGRAPIVLGALALSFLIRVPERPARASAADSSQPGATAPPRKSVDFDYGGAVLLVLWLVPLLLGSALSANLPDLTVSLALWAMAAVAFAAFIWRERRHAEPIIRPALFRDAGFTLMNLQSILVNYAAFSILLLAPFYLVKFRGFDAVTGGALLALSGIGTVVGASLAGRIAPRVGTGALTGVGLALSALGLLGIGLLAPAASISGVAISLALQGFGIGLFQVGYTDLVTTRLPREDRGVAGSLTMVTRTIGTVAGATAHAATQRWGEAAARANGVPEAELFLAGFQTAFIAASIASACALLIAIPVLLMRPSPAAKAAPTTDHAA